MECTIKDISINYEIIGDGKPIVMLHGYFVDHRLMSASMEPVFKNEDNYKRIYIDLPGMGRSQAKSWITNADIMLDILTEFIDKVIPNENFLLAGESYGGYLSRGLIYKMPNRIDGALLICPVIIAEGKDRNVSNHVVLVEDKDLLSKLTPKDAEDFASMAVIQNEKTYKRYKEEIISGVKLADSKFLKNFQKRGYEFSFNEAMVNEEFNKPTLMLLGRQDSCVGYKDAWNVLEKYPRATFAILDMAGHNLQIEQEDLFNSLVSEWLERVNKS